MNRADKRKERYEKFGGAYETAMLDALDSLAEIKLSKTPTDYVMSRVIRCEWLLENALKASGKLKK